MSRKTSKWKKNGKTKHGGNRKGEFHKSAEGDSNEPSSDAAAKILGKPLRKRTSLGPKF